MAQYKVIVSLISAQYFAGFYYCRTNQDLARTQRVFNDTRMSGNVEVLELISRQMQTEMIKYVYVYLTVKLRPKSQFFHAYWISFLP